MAKNKDQDKSNSEDSNVVPTWMKFVPDESLLAIFESSPDDEISVIVEADLPKRFFTFDKQSGGPAKFRAVTPESNPNERNSILEQLTAKMKEIAGPENANMLSTAGAIVVKIQAKQLPKLAQLPDVKAIRINRKLPKPSSSKT